VDLHVANERFERDYRVLIEDTRVELDEYPQFASWPAPGLVDTRLS
jgi:hypothetical protein